MENKFDKHTHHHEPLIFPKGFLWGSSTSAHQVEVHNRASDWWAWEQIDGNIANHEISGNATHHYEMYEKDFDLVKKMYQNSHRLSIEWSRLEPREGEWNADALQHYHEVFQTLHKRGIRIVLTLNHFTLPQWIALSGGWLHKDTVVYFERFVKKVVEEYGDVIDMWITINEPNVYLSMSYISGLWPPGKKNSYLSLIKGFYRLLSAHKKAYRIIHKSYPKAQVGIAKNMISFVAYGGYSFLDFLYLKTLDLFWNHLFLKLSKKYHDFIGINYYFHQRVERKNILSYPFVNIHEEKREHSDLGWEIYPEGIFNILHNIKRYKKPIYITENGVAAENDDKRIRFIIGHLKEIYHAIQSGVDIRGYFYWSLLDNFEWHEGFRPRFGLVHVNYKTFKRTPRQSAFIYEHIAKQNAIDHELFRYLGHGVRDFCEECHVPNT